MCKNKEYNSKARKMDLRKNHSQEFQSLLAKIEENMDLSVQEAAREIKSQAFRKLELIDEIYKDLITKADTIIEKTKADLRLHTIKINAQKIRGHLYYLYSSDHEDEFFSILEPKDYFEADPNVKFIDAYRLNEDNTWSKIKL